MDILHNSGGISGGVGASFVMHVPYREYKLSVDTFWSNQERF